MKNTQLRVGNYLELNGNIGRVLEIYANAIKLSNTNTNCAYFIEHFKPIELTEEILLKCGFKYLGNGFYESSCSNISIFSLSGSIKINIGFKGVIIGEIKHLHILQNITYFLTNKELEINL